MPTPRVRLSIPQRTFVLRGASNELPQVRLTISSNNCIDSPRSQHPEGNDISSASICSKCLDNISVNDSNCPKNNKLKHSLQGFEQEDIDNAYEMELEQLKRQNRFLKNKIQQLKSLIPERELSHKKYKKHKNNKKMLKSHIELSLEFIYDQITRIVRNCANVFNLRENIDLNQSKILQTQDKNDSNITLDQHLKESENIVIQMTPMQLGQKLDWISLMQPQARYGNLLRLFSEYYVSVQKFEQSLKLKVQKLSLQAMAISKQLLQHWQSKRLNHSRYNQFYLHDLKPNQILLNDDFFDMADPRPAQH